MKTKICGLALAAAVSLAVLQAQQPAPSPVPQQPAQPATTQPSTTQQPAQTSPGQQPAAPNAAPDQSDDIGQVLHLGVNEVNLIFTVTDKHGHYIPNLKQNDFALLDDQNTRKKLHRSASRSIFRCAWELSSMPARLFALAFSLSSRQPTSSCSRFSNPAKTGRL